ncbi:hypothetical protein BH09BAC3_BH09BAC3_24520 [soil metagenome]
MSLRHFIAGFIIFILISGAPADQYPQTEITNGLIRARLYLPDSEAGFYRGTRFDWAGVIPDLEYQGHQYFGQWYTQEHDPTFHDHIVGPVEEFTPIGYEAAKVGDTFLKIGVGMLVKPEEEKYFFGTRYKNVNSGTWKTKRKSDQVDFTQKLVDANYAYEYKKTVQLTKGKPELVLSHALKNTGKQVIETNVYDHNFFVLDQQPVSNDVEISFPFTLVSETPPVQPLGKLQDNRIVFERELIDNEHLYYKSLTGFGNAASDYDIKIENHKTGAAVRITGDHPLTRLVFWCAPKTVCPEPYIHLTIKPGETVTWKINYLFYILQDSK